MRGGRPEQKCAGLSCRCEGTRMASARSSTRLAIGLVLLCTLPLLAVLGVMAVRSPQGRIVRYTRSGDRYLAAERYGEAALAFRNILQIAPQSAQAHYKLGLASLRMGDPALSYRELTKSLELDGKILDAHLMLGEISLLVGQYSQARDQAQFVLGKDPSSGDAHVLLARSMAATRDLDGALREVHAALRTAPNSARAYTLLAGIQTAKGDDAQAEKSLRQGISAAPAEPEPRIALANLLLRQGRRDAAEQVLKEAAGAMPRRAISSPAPTWSGRTSPPPKNSSRKR